MPAAGRGRVFLGLAGRALARDPSLCGVSAVRTAVVGFSCSGTMAALLVYVLCLNIVPSMERARRVCPKSVLRVSISAGRGKSALPFVCPLPAPSHILALHK